MKHSKKTEEIVLKYVSQYKLDIVNFACIYGDWLAYNVSSNALQQSFCGYPHYVFIREDLKCRFANHDEVIEIMKILSST